MQKYDRMIASDGSLNLYAWRKPERSFGKPVLVRENYSRHYPVITTSREFTASLRAGAYAWPGGYEIVFVCDDGATLCHKCARNVAPQIMRDIAEHNRGSGWRVTGLFTTAETDERVQCDHCNRVLQKEWQVES
jgi:hypothetical protein